jgi:hypothetical protein
MGCRESGEHASLGAAAHIEHRQDQEVAKAAAHEVADSEIRKTEAYGIKIHHQLRQRGRPRQKEAPNQQPPEPGEIGNGISKVRKCGSGNHDDASRNEELKRMFTPLI